MIAAVFLRVHAFLRCSLPQNQSQLEDRHRGIQGLRRMERRGCVKCSALAIHLRAAHDMCPHPAVRYTNDEVDGNRSEVAVFYKTATCYNSPRVAPRSPATSTLFSNFNNPHCTGGAVVPPCSGLRGWLGGFLNEADDFIQNLGQGETCHWQHNSYSVMGDAIC